VREDYDRKGEGGCELLFLGVTSDFHLCLRDAHRRSTRTCKVATVDNRAVDGKSAVKEKKVVKLPPIGSGAGHLDH